jgi:hypothetical protein
MGNPYGGGIVGYRNFEEALQKGVFIMKGFEYGPVRISISLFVLLMLISSFTVLIISCATGKYETGDSVIENYEIEDRDNASLWRNRASNPSLFREEISFSIIPDDQKNEYINRLEHTQYVELERDEYLRLTNKNQKKEYALAIRAVYPHLGGFFFVTKNSENKYLVWYAVTGSRVWELNKTVLLIEADELPTEIFNGYTVAR